MGIELPPPKTEKIPHPIRDTLRGWAPIIPRPKIFGSIFGQITVPLTAADIVKVAQTDWARNAARGWISRFATTGAFTPEQLENIERTIRVTYAAGLLKVADSRMIEEALRQLETLEKPKPAAPAPTRRR